jgi:hypothetical protein
VAEEDRGGAEAFGGLVEGGVAGGAGGGLGTAAAADGHGEGLGRFEGELGEPGDDLAGPVAGAGLQAVVDGDAPGPQTEAGGFEGEGGGERHRVGAAGAGDEYERGPPARGGAGDAGDAVRDAA